MKHERFHPIAIAILFKTNCDSIATPKIGLKMSDLIIYRNLFITSCPPLGLGMGEVARVATSKRSQTH